MADYCNQIGEIIHKMESFTGRMAPGGEDLRVF